MNTTGGRVYLVGAGPGDPGLVTVRALELLRAADVVIHDRLIPHELLDEVRAEAIVIDAGKAPGMHMRTQVEINALLVAHASTGRNVVRLKGGDPFVFGRGYEEWLACQAAGIHCEVVPGVSSAIAGPAAAGVPVTHRGAARNFAVVTARTGASDEPTALDYAALARLDTLVVLMGRAALREVTTELIRAGRDAGTPAACVQNATTTAQRVVAADLGGIAERADAAELEAPMVLIVGEVAAFATGLPDGGAEPANRSAGGRRPLHRRRVVVTGSARLNRTLGRQLRAAGASVLECGLVSIRYGVTAADRAVLAREMERLDWLVIASAHAVRGFGIAMRSAAIDLRQLAGVGIAAVGVGTAEALAQLGLRANLIPNTQSAAGLVAELARRVRGSRILLPCGDLSRPELRDGLAAAGAHVSRIVVYRNEAAAVNDAVAGTLREGFDAVVFASPSAIARFGALGIDVGAAVVACIGPTTARTAAALSLAADVTATEHSAAGIVRALIEYFSNIEVHT